ncbi:MAG: hypothetical protein QOF37_1230 [Thermoleophilaceae bacterium]|nr:hypothetical protein [Thermoleophilaceae bacterium]
MTLTSLLNTYLGGSSNGHGQPAPSAPHAAASLPAPTAAVTPPTVPAHHHAAAPAAALDSADPAISMAFAAGWQMTEIHHRACQLYEGRTEQSLSSPVGNCLPGLRDLGVAERAALGINEIEVALFKLRDRFASAAIDPVSIGDLRPALAACRKDDSALVEAVKDKHSELLRSLMAADFRLGKAYRLGVELAETALQPEGQDNVDTAFGARAVSIRTALADLASVLPEHSSRAVSLSIRTWERWASEPEIDGKPVGECTWAAVRSALRRQGELWRALLSGEKHGEDMLSMPDYVRAANGLVGQAAKTMLQFTRTRRIALPVTVIVILLGGGIALLTLNAGASSKIVGGIAAAAGAVGITGAGLRSRASRVAMQLEGRLWAAEMDVAIADAITVGPEGWGVSVKDISLPAAGETPKAGGQLRLIAAFQRALEKGDHKALDRLLAKRVFFDVNGTKIEERGKVVSWASDLPDAERRELARRAGQVVAGYPGSFVVYVEDGGDLWRVRENKISCWRTFGKRDEARAGAGLTGER